MTDDFPHSSKCNFNIIEGAINGTELLSPWGRNIVETRVNYQCHDFGQVRFTIK